MPLWFSYLPKEAFSYPLPWIYNPIVRDKIFLIRFLCFNFFHLDTRMGKIFRTFMKIIEYIHMFLAQTFVLSASKNQKT